MTCASDMAHVGLKEAKKIVAELEEKARKNGWEGSGDNRHRYLTATEDRRLSSAEAIVLNVTETLKKCDTVKELCDILGALKLVGETTNLFDDRIYGLKNAIALRIVRSLEKFLLPEDKDFDVTVLEKTKTRVSAPNAAEAERKARTGFAKGKEIVSVKEVKDGQL